MTKENWDALKLQLYEYRHKLKDNKSRPAVMVLAAIEMVIEWMKKIEERVETDG